MQASVRQGGAGCVFLYPAYNSIADSLVLEELAQPVAGLGGFDV